MIAQAYGYGAATATLDGDLRIGRDGDLHGALRLVAGEADAVVVGGAEAPLIPLLAAQLRAARVVGWDEDPAATCKPFDARRNGLMIGEGAAVLVLEPASSASRRGVPILARLSGWAAGSDKGGRTGVTIDGQVWCASRGVPWSGPASIPRR